MLIDEIEITLKGGHGGAGKVSFYPGLKSGPDGGNGGKGGDILANVTSNITALNQFSHKKVLEAENGQPGKSNCRFGSDGEDLVILFPIGTTLIDQQTREEIELDNLDKKVLLCKGGIGGRGNAVLASPRHTTPLRAQIGMPGQERKFLSVLKLIADFGLIGLPNSGKSSLLNELTSTNVKTAEYPFTTLEPNLGVIGEKIMADVPGLIEGASGGKGLGIKFLKHIEKVGILLHCLDSNSTDLEKDYEVVRGEMGKFNPKLLEKEEIILLTKSDLADPEKLKEDEDIFRKKGKKVLPVSIYDWDSLEKLKKILNLIEKSGN
ncbi:MAG: GTPase ObgE [Candidatus Daviesbacteria bacterium]